jgi:hypothetical protein
MTVFPKGKHDQADPTAQLQHQEELDDKIAAWSMASRGRLGGVCGPLGARHDHDNRNQRDGSRDPDVSLYACFSKTRTG